MIRIVSLACALLLLPAAALAKIGVGDQAPPITLEALTNVPESAPDHSELAWDHFEGKTVVLEFWGTWCGPCVAAIPHLNELAEATADDGVAFLSVTFEDAEIVEKFLDRMEMKSWVGHDTDRSMVDAFGVRAWPTTFIVRDGLVLDRTHPTGLTKDRLLELATGDPDAIVDTARAQEAEREAAEASERTARWDAEPILEISLAPTPEDFTGGSTRSAGLRNMEAKGATRASIARMLWGAYTHQDIAIDAPDERYNLIIDAAAAPEDAVREILARTLNLEMTVETREMDGFAATLGGRGVTLRDGLMDQSMGYSIRQSTDAITITSSSITLPKLLAALESTLDVPVRNDTGVSPDRYFFVDLELPRDTADLITAMKRETGVVLEPALLEREVAVIRSRSED